MSIPNLPVNFKDDILAASNPKRKYQQTFNSDGSVSLEDVTVYTQQGSNFGASQVNQTNGAINNIYNERVIDLDELDLVTEPGFFVDALAVKELNSKISGELALTSDFKNASSDYNPTYEKTRWNVHISGEVSPTKTIPGSPTRYVIATLPKGCRPAREEYFVCQGSSTAIWLLGVLPNGEITFQRYRKGNSYADVTSSNWLAFSATFMPA